jgi:DNA-binding CsgD family transcriptional regulator
LLTLRGDFEPAGQALADLSEMLGPGVEAQFNGPIAADEIVLAMLTGETAAGRKVADRVLGILGQTEDRSLQGRVLVAALRLEAGTAEHARAARDSRALDEAVGRGTSFLGAVRRLVDDVPPGPNLDEVKQAIAFAEAEATRLTSAPDAAVWRRALALARARGPVYDAAYATYRLAEALLPDRSARDDAACLLTEAYEEASRLGARPLGAAIEALAARARVPLRSDDAALADGSGGGDATASEQGLAAYGLSEREIEVLRLLAAGRTNRQIGEALFISESTAGVHVSHILAKFGVAGRVEAATVAARLGLTG